MRAFVSHVSEEARQARALKAALEEAVPGADVFVSAADIGLGDRWLRAIEDALENAAIVLVLCSPRSVQSPWLNFESGGGLSRRLPVVPVCYAGMRQDQLPHPLAMFQGVELTSAAAFERLAGQVAAAGGGTAGGGIDPARLLAELNPPLPPRTADVGIVLCHRQGEWPQGPGATVFGLPGPLPPETRDRWSFRRVDDARTLLSPDLHTLSGLVFASPWRARIDPEAVSAVAGWVRAGGRLLLLGFELGDRHHDANLFDLAHPFGIHPQADIVGPATFTRKPIREEVAFDCASGDPHPFTAGLGEIRLADVQTLRAAPGGTEWLRVGENAVFVPRREDVRYYSGTFSAPGEAGFQPNLQAGWLPVAVEAPAGLCGEGGVHMIGSWDLIGRARPFGGDNVTLLARMLDWLSRTDG